MLGKGILVASNTTVVPVMPLYQFVAGSYAAPSGSDPSLAMSLWTPPLFIENPTSATLTQRGGASLALRSQSTSFNGASAGGGTIVVSEGHRSGVDPGQSITLNAFGQITIRGDLTAHGGSIALINSADGTQVDAARNFDALGNGRGVSIWVDANAKLDVSGVAYQAVDVSGHRYGTATDGGAITITGGGAFVILRPGAELDADGAQTVIDSAGGGVAPTSTQPIDMGHQRRRGVAVLQQWPCSRWRYPCDVGWRRCVRWQPLDLADHADFRDKLLPPGHGAVQRSGSEHDDRAAGAPKSAQRKRSRRRCAVSPVRTGGGERRHGEGRRLRQPVSLVRRLHAVRG